jgi:hypothetical protein
MLTRTAKYILHIVRTGTKAKKDRSFFYSYLFFGLDFFVECICLTVSSQAGIERALPESLRKLPNSYSGCLRVLACVLISQVTDSNSGFL